MPGRCERRFRAHGNCCTPKIGAAVQKRDAIDVGVAVRADLADDAGLDFLVRSFVANDEFLLGVELVRGDNSGAVAAEHNSFAELGKDAAFHVASDESDSGLFGNASTATCAVLRHKSVPLVEGDESWAEPGPNLRLIVAREGKSVSGDR